MMCKAYLVIITGWKNEKEKHCTYDLDQGSEFYIIHLGDSIIDGHHSNYGQLLKS